MKNIILKIDGMTCSACSSSLEKYLKKQKGIDDALVNLVMATASITYSEDLTISDLERFVNEAGFKSLGEYDISQENTPKKEKKSLIINGILALILLYISMSHMLNLPVIPFLDMSKCPVNYAFCLFIFTLYFIYFGKDILLNGLKKLKYKSPNMDTLVSLGVISSFLYSTYNLILIVLGNASLVENLYFESASIILYLIKLGRYIDNISKERTKDAIKGLVSITPKTALIKSNNTFKEVTIDSVKKGDILLVKPGMKFAVDGYIIKGETHIDESFITGESLPSKKQENDKVVAGSINIDGTVEYKADKIGKDSTISEIVRLVVDATNTKAPIARVADKVSSVFVPIIILVAIITFVFYLLLGYKINEAIISFVTVLVVACPCALGLATPLAIVVGEGICAKNGILVKKSETLENANKVDTIVFDKTGTLTYGKLKVSKINNYSSLNDKDLMQLIASLENNSSHPISIAFKDYTTEKNIEILETTKFKNIEGIGISGVMNNKNYYAGSKKILTSLNIKDNYEEEEKNLSSNGCSIVYLTDEKNILALIGVKDIVRDNAKQVISKLYKMHKEVIMLTGDNEITANIIAKQIGIKKVIANVLPKEKSDVIKKLKEEKSVMMIGDGINDAPSLAAADIGISLNSATDIASSSADVILISDNLAGIYDLIDISKKTLRNIKQNLFWAFFYNLCMIPIAIGLLKGLNITMNPMIAALAMTLSSLTVILNALRLKFWKEK